MQQSKIKDFRGLYSVSQNRPAKQMHHNHLRVSWSEKIVHESYVKWSTNRSWTNNQIKTSTIRSNNWWNCLFLHSFIMCNSDRASYLMLDWVQNTLQCILSLYVDISGWIFRNTAWITINKTTNIRLSHPIMCFTYSINLN